MEDEEDSGDQINNDLLFEELWNKHAPKWAEALDIPYVTVKEKIMSEDDLILVIFGCLSNTAIDMASEGKLQNSPKYPILKAIFKKPPQALWEELASIYDDISDYLDYVRAEKQLSELIKYDVPTYEYEPRWQIPDNDDESDDDKQTWRDEEEEVNNDIEITEKVFGDFDAQFRKLIENRGHLLSKYAEEEEIADEIGEKYCELLANTDSGFFSEKSAIKAVKKYTEKLGILNQYFDRFLELYIACKKANFDSLQVKYDEDEIKREGFGKLWDIANDSRDPERAVCHEIRMMQRQLDPQSYKGVNLSVRLEGFAKVMQGLIQVFTGKQ